MSKPWPMVKLGEVLIEQKCRIGNFDADGQILLGVSNQQGLHRSAMPRISDMSRYLRVEKDWFAYNPMRINVGSLGYARFDDLVGVISPDYVVFSCSQRVMPEWVYAFLKHPVGLNAINAATAGSVRERLYFSKLAEIEIPLPPLAEQRRIVARIEELAEQIHEAQRLRKEAAEEAEVMIKSFARKAFGEEPNGDWIRLGEFVSKIENGKSPATEGRPAASDEWAVLKVGAVSFGFFDERQNKALPPSYEVPANLEVKAGDFIMSRANTVELVGACALVRKTRPRLMLSDKSFRFVFEGSRPLLPEYMEQVLRSPALRTQIEAGASGTSPTMKNISKEKVLNLLLPNHSLPEQRRIVSELDALQAEVDALKRLQAETSAELAALLPSILDRAFKGEL